MSALEKTKKSKNETFVTRLFDIITERSILLDFREIGLLIRYEFRRIILTLKYFIAMSLILLPAIIFLNSISSEYEALILDFGVKEFQKFSAEGYVVMGQFLMQLMGLTLVLDSFGKAANESMTRYFSQPIRKINIYRSHFITVILGVSIIGILSIVIFNFILWIWTGISLTFILMLQAFFLTLLGALLVIAITLLFVIIAHFFNVSSSVAIIPTLFLFYIIPFLVNFVAQFIFSIPRAYEWTFMYHLAIITKYLLNTMAIEKTLIRNSSLIIGLITIGSESIAKIIFMSSEK